MDGSSTDGGLDEEEDLDSDIDILDMGNLELGE